ncbi:hypothetical protein [Simiduia aestuariiviva]|uniref:Cell division inhibitor SulA n=1 Tax=Simiduia aestuariiviva TaxID=1510459 RepID=A0A839UPS9_9GAMM|nr:hypothetical protein [Simiduia aestuariiviva]MBB3168520.1 cell division inhibitor SulA [Simiduia aestuariiviva]
MATALQNLQEPTTLPRAQPAKVAPSRITELVIPSSEHQAVLLPMMRYLGDTNAHQWLTLISQSNQQQQPLKAHGVNPHTLRVIQAQSTHDVLWMTWEALSNGTSHTVIAELGPQPQDVLKELERAAAEGNCRLILVRCRSN